MTYLRSVTPAGRAYLNRLIAISLSYESNVSTLVWGDPGQGKSALLDAFAADRGIHHEVVVASLREPTDLNGLPVTTDAGTVRLAPPAWLTAINANPGSLVVFDEITTAPPATRAACLRVVNERVSADTPLDPSVRVFAVANPPEVAEDGWELGAPMSNRFFHVRDWSLPAEIFTAGLTAGAWAKVPVCELDPERLAVCLADARAAVAGFVHGDPGMLTRLPAHPADRQYPWPSPRTWTMCATLLGYAHAARFDGEPVDEDVITLIVEGTVGPVAGPVFLAFLTALELPDPETLLADPTHWQVPDRGDLAFAVLSRLLTYLAGKGEHATKSDWKNAGKVIAYAAHGQGDVAVAVAAEWWQHAKAHGPAVLPAEMASAGQPLRQRVRPHPRFLMPSQAAVDAAAIAIAHERSQLALPADELEQLARYALTAAEIARAGRPPRRFDQHGTPPQPEWDAAAEAISTHFDLAGLPYPARALANSALQGELSSLDVTGLPYRPGVPRGRTLRVYECERGHRTLEPAERGGCVTCGSERLDAVTYMSRPGRDQRPARPVGA